MVQQSIQQLLPWLMQNLQNGESPIVLPQVATYISPFKICSFGKTCRQKFLDAIVVVYVATTGSAIRLAHPEKRSPACPGAHRASVGRIRTTDTPEIPAKIKRFFHNRAPISRFPILAWFAINSLGRPAIGFKLKQVI